MNTFKEFVLTNGEKVKLTLTFGKLNVLKSYDNALYTKFNKILAGKSEDILDLTTIIYVAYWCYNFSVEKKNDIYKEQDFLELVPFDINSIKQSFNALTQPKKNMGFENRS